MKKENRHMKKEEIEPQVKCICGCIVNRSDLIRSRAINYENVRLRCPDHAGTSKGDIEFRIFKCVDCEEIVYADPKANNKVRCDKCQKIKVKLDAEKNRQPRSRPKQNKNRIGLICPRCEKVFNAKEHGMIPKHCKKCTKELVAEQSQARTNGPEIKKTNNIFDCKDFKTCGQCIKPYFPCKIYNAQLRRKTA